eukprot:1369590-Amorphochlora_amoeboformis.AAC.1
MPSIAQRKRKKKRKRMRRASFAHPRTVRSKTKTESANVFDKENSSSQNVVTPVAQGIKSSVNVLVQLRKPPIVKSPDSKELDKIVNALKLLGSDSDDDIKSEKRDLAPSLQQHLGASMDELHNPLPLTVPPQKLTIETLTPVDEESTAVPPQQLTIETLTPVDEESTVTSQPVLVEKPRTKAATSDLARSPDAPSKPCIEFHKSAQDPTMSKLITVEKKEALETLNLAVQDFGKVPQLAVSSITDEKETVKEEAEITEGAADLDPEKSSLNSQILNNPAHDAADTIPKADVLGEDSK